MNKQSATGRKYSSFIKATIGDAPAIAELNKQFHLDIPGFRWDTPPWIKDEISKGRYYVVRDSQGVAGALWLHVDGQEQAGIY